MRQESRHPLPFAREDPWSSSTQGVRSIRVPLLSRQAAGLVVVGFSVLAWWTETKPMRPEARPRLIRGEPGVQIWSFVLSADGKTMAAIDSSGSVMLREATSGWAVERTLPFSGFARALAFSADGRWLACGGFSAGITLYDLESNAEARTLAVPVDRVKAIAFAPDGRTVAVAAVENPILFVWDLTAGRVRRKLDAPGLVQSIAFAPDGHHLASGGRAGTPSIVLWDLDTGRSRVPRQDTHGPINVIAFSPDGTWLVTASAWERCVQTWDVSSGEPGPVIEGHRQGTNAVAFSPDGLTLATAGNDGTVRLWTVATWQEQAVLDGGGLAMGPVTFSSGGDCLVATAKNDDDIRVWNLAELGPRAIPGHHPN